MAFDNLRKVTTPATQVDFLFMGESKTREVIVDETLQTAHFPPHPKETLIPVQVTQVNSVTDLYVCIHPLHTREEFQEQIDYFYSDGEGRDWLVDNPRPGRLYAAPYENEGYHRTLLRKSVSNSKVELFYVDFGTMAKVNISRLRLLDLDFLKHPAMAIQVSLWGLRGEAKSELLQMLKYGNQLEGDLLAKVEKTGDKPAIWLIDNTVPNGRCINSQLTTEKACKWCLPDLYNMVSEKKPVPETDEKAVVEFRHSSIELEAAIEIQMALVNLIQLDSNLNTKLMEKLVEAKRNLQLDFSSSKVMTSTYGVLKEDDEKMRKEVDNGEHLQHAEVEENRRILVPDYAKEEPELESDYEKEEHELASYEDGEQTMMSMEELLHKKQIKADLKNNFKNDVIVKRPKLFVKNQITKDLKKRLTEDEAESKDPAEALSPKLVAKIQIVKNLKKNENNGVVTLRPKVTGKRFH